MKIFNRNQNTDLLKKGEEMINKTLEQSDDMFKKILKPISRNKSNI